MAGFTSPNRSAADSRRTNASEYCPTWFRAEPVAATHQRLHQLWEVVDANYANLSVGVSERMW